MVKPVISSIDDVLRKGLIDQKASETLKEDIAKPVLVSPGEEVCLDSNKIQAADIKIEKTLERIARNETGNVTAENPLQMVKH